MNYCPCCKDILLHHADSGGAYWFCRSCWQAMPVCSCKQLIQSSETMPTELPPQLNPLNKANSLVPFTRNNIVNYPQSSSNLSS
ncbi:hypothetical protein Riv7116_3020 [Rivularia sp. PCC 7116]|uniref:hypothetical protein n=1 Tax=Rivularia sp. PCC 7116 TaxID=373994 RepID=UPI00029F3D3A|nr:hypothetical protein [Rivularia sp. PCC 7116]AFY55500.1 hypothetical protein Riv7116_3020 [Rivularia sp. PCC 7116]